METGTIRKVVVDHGFAFIAQHGGPDVFMHLQSLQGGLEWGEQLTGQRVEFELGIDPRSGKPRASAVWPAKG